MRKHLVTIARIVRNISRINFPVCPHIYRSYEQSGHRPALDTPPRSPINSVGNVSQAVHYALSVLTQPPPSVNKDNVQILTSEELCSKHQDEYTIGEKCNKQAGAELCQAQIS